jgi:hypothetical protein
VLLQKKRAQSQKESKEIVQIAADVIKAINNKTVAGESIVSKARTSSFIAVKKRTSLTITAKRPVTISLKGNTNIAKIKH